MKELFLTFETKDNTIQGILYLEELQKITVDGQLTQRPLKMSYAEGETLSLKIEEMKLFLLIEWEPRFFPKDAGHAVTKIEIEAGKIYWKNVQFPEQNGDQVFSIEDCPIEIERSRSRLYPPLSD